MFKYGKLRDMIEKYVRVQNRRYDHQSFKDDDDQDVTLDMNFRDGFVDKSLNPAAGKLSAHSGEQYRKWGDLMLNTAFYTGAPLAHTANKYANLILYNNFVMVIGQNKQNENKEEEFVPIRMLQRDSPHTPSVVVTKNKKGEFVANPDKVTGSAQLTKYFTRKWVESGKAFRAEMDQKFKDELKSSYTKDVQPKNEMVDLGFTKEISYHSLVKVEKTTVELWYQRETAYVETRAKKTDRNAIYTVTGTQKDRLVVTLNCKHEDGHEMLQGSAWESRKNTCSVGEKKLYTWKDPNKIDIKFEAVTEKARINTSSEKKYKEKKKAKDAQEKQKKEAFSSKNEEEKIEAINAAFKELQAEKEFKEVVLGADDGQTSKRQFMADPFIQETDNKQEKFRLSKSEVSDILFDGDEILIWTYPGKLAAGSSPDGGRTRVCNVRTCTMSSDQWDANIGSFQDFSYRLYQIGNKEGEDGQEWRTNPFAFAEWHKYTANPLPGFFVKQPWFFLAVIANAGQSWMSAYLSKILSSLWKNICAAVALTLVVILEKIFIATPQDKARTDWPKVLTATLGVIFTVLVFQLAPKAPKPEPKKDIESGRCGGRCC